MPISNAGNFSLLPPPTYTHFHIGCILLETISFSLYIKLLLGIAQSKNPILHSPFFSMFFSIGVSDVISLAINGILRHLTVYMIGPEETWEWLYRVVYLVSAVVFYVHFFGLSFLSLNRFTCVFLPGQHRKFWAIGTRWFIFAKWFTSFALISYRLSSSLKFHDRKDGTYLVLGYNDSAVHLLSHRISGTVCGISTIITFILSSLTIAKLFLFRVKFARAGAVSKERPDQELIAWISAQYFWINDILVFSNLYTLIICCWPVAHLLQEAKWSDQVPRLKASNMEATFGLVYSMRVQWDVYASTFEVMQKFIR